MSIEAPVQKVGHTTTKRLTRTPIVFTDQLPSYVEAAQWVFGMKAKHVQGKTITNHVERQNLTKRMAMRRFIRRTNGFSKRLEYHAAMAALYVCFYNWCRIHGSFRVTPAMAAGLTTSLRDLEWVVELVDARAPKPNRPKKYRKRRVA